MQQAGAGVLAVMKAGDPSPHQRVNLKHAPAIPPSGGDCRRSTGPSFPTGCTGDAAGTIRPRLENMGSTSAEYEYLVVDTSSGRMGGL